MAWIQSRKLWAFCLCVIATVFLLVTLQVVVELGKFERKKFKDSSFQDGHKNVEEKPTELIPFPQEALALHGKNALNVGSYPIMLWWSPLTGETGRLGQCGADTCFFTINRSLQHHHMTKAFLFYEKLLFSDGDDHWHDPKRNIVLRRRDGGVSSTETSLSHPPSLGLLWKRWQKECKSQRKDTTPYNATVPTEIGLDIHDLAVPSNTFTRLS